MLRLKIHRGWVLFIMLLTVTSPSFAQGTTKLTGTVTDANGAFLPYVSVTAKQSGSAKVSVGITDAKGYYEITIPQCDSLHVTYTYTGFVEKSFILHSQCARESRCDPFANLKVTPLQVTFAKV